MIGQAPRISPTATAGSRADSTERTIWEGRPSRSGTFWQVFRARWVLLYLGVLLAFRVGDAIASGADSGAIVGAVTSVAVLTLVLGGLLALFARLTADASSYAITDRRIVIKLGVALPMTIDLPLSIVDRADLVRRHDGSGDIVLTLNKDQSASYIVLWPHVRPFRLLRVQPMLRAVPDVDAAAEALAKALGSDHHARASERVNRAVPDAAGAAV